MKKTEITISFGVAVHEFGQPDLEIPIGSPVGVVPQRTMDFACNNASLQRIAGPWATKMYQNIAKMAAWTITHKNRPISSNEIEFRHCKATRSMTYHGHALGRRPMQRFVAQFGVVKWASKWLCGWLRITMNESQAMKSNCNIVKPQDLWIAMAMHQACHPCNML